MTNPLTPEGLTDDQAFDRHRALDAGNFEADTIATVEKGEEVDGGAYYIITGQRGWTFGRFFVPDHIDPPQTGDPYRTYGTLGRPVIGGDLRDQPCWFKTQAEQDAEQAAWAADNDAKKTAWYEKNQERLDAEYAALPEGLRKRIDRFVANCPSPLGWWVEYGGYEMSALKAALAIYEAATQADDPDAAVIAFYEMGWGEQVQRVPVLGELGMAGNQFGYACTVARQMLLPDEDERAKVLEWSHGAMVMLTGCEQYGCIAPPEGLFSDDTDTDEPPADEVAETEAVLNDEAAADAIRDAEAEDSTSGDPWDAAMAEFERKPIGALGKYVRDHTEMVQPGTEGAISVHFFSVKPVREPSLTTFVDKIAACLVEGEGEFTDFDPETLRQGQSYIALGAWIGSQEIALRLLALGDHLGAWQVITPGLLGVSGAEADSMAGMGFVMASGYTPEGMDPSSRYTPKPESECCGNTPHDADCPLVLATAETIAQRMVEHEAKSEGVGG